MIWYDKMGSITEPQNGLTDPAKEERDEMKCAKCIGWGSRCVHAYIQHILQTIKRKCIEAVIGTVFTVHAKVLIKSKTHTHTHTHIYIQHVYRRSIY